MCSTQLGRDVKDALEELRDLAHGIFPPLLADRGLAEALTAATRRASSDAPGSTLGGVARYSHGRRDDHLLLLPRGTPERLEARRPGQLARRYAYERTRAVCSSR